MCNPALAIGAAMMVAGTAVQQSGVRKAERAQQAAQRAETERQNRYMDESMGVFGKSVAKADAANQMQELQDRINARANDYSDVVKDYDVNTDILSGQQSAPRVVLDTVAAKSNEAAAKQRAEGIAKAFLDAWGDQNLANAVANQRNADQIGMVGGFSRGSAGILPYELEAAKRKGAGTRMFGQLLSQGGGIVMGAGAGGLGDIFSTGGGPPGMWNGGTGTNPMTGMRIGGV